MGEICGEEWVLHGNMSKVTEQGNLFGTKYGQGGLEGLPTAIAWSDT